MNKKELAKKRESAILDSRERAIRDS